MPTDNQPAKKPRRSLRRMVGLPAGINRQPVSPAEFETAQRIFARWMFEHPEVTELVLRKQANSGI
jgi:hypothetical protein